MQTYTVLEASKLLGISTRAVQKRCSKEKIRKKDNRYLITNGHITTWRIERTANELKNEPNEPNERTNQLDLEVESLKLELSSEKEQNKILKDQLENSKNNLQLDLNQAIDIITAEAIKQGVTHKIFTHGEFEDIIGTIALSEHQEEQITYLRNRIEKQDKALISIAKQVEQRNYIEARDKGYDTK